MVKYNLLILVNPVRIRHVSCTITIHIRSRYSYFDLRDQCLDSKSSLVREYQLPNIKENAGQLSLTPGSNPTIMLNEKDAELPAVLKITFKKLNHEK